jgi:SAM-dependent methyltransferase
MSFHVHLFDLYGRLRAAIVPTLRYAQDYYQRRLEDALASDVDWLDLGCGHRVLPEWRPDAERALVAKCRSVTGIDYDLPSLQQHRSFNRLVRGDIGALPFRDESFDLVTANMVVEHLANPAGQFAEIGRVLRPGGTLLLHTPNARGYRTILGRLVPEVLKRPLIWILDTRPGADVFPTHYRANTEDQLGKVAAEAGLGVKVVSIVETDALFAVIAPLAALELILIKLLLTKRLRRFRSNIIATLTKPGSVAKQPVPKQQPWQIDSSGTKDRFATPAAISAPQCR